MLTPGVRIHEHFPRKLFARVDARKKRKRAAVPRAARSIQRPSVENESESLTFDTCIYWSRQVQHKAFLGSGVHGFHARPTTRTSCAKQMKQKSFGTEIPLKRSLPTLHSNP
jgi:hypothetical protein